MLKNIKFRLMSRFLVLGILLGGLTVIWSAGNNDVKASFCCSYCVQQADDCYQNPNPGCTAFVTYCYNHCDACSTGGGGAECDSDDDCNTDAAYHCVNNFCTIL